jgi:type I restriction enzyme M protein
LLYIKWIKSLIDNLNKLPDEVLSEFTKSIENATKKYDTTLVDLDKEINETEKELSNMIDNLTGDEFDMKGLEEFKTLLGGE